MKRIKYLPGSDPGKQITLFQAITDIDNIRLAYKHASRGKHRRDDVREFEKNLDKNIQDIRNSLVNKTFTTSEYHVFEKMEGRKLRTIYELPFMDRVVQWAILQIIGPILEKRFIYHSYSSIKGRGPLLCMLRIRRAIHFDKENTQYYLKIDIKKFYPSINHDILKQKYRKIFKNNDLLWLLDDIIDSTPPEEGIPIGNYLSQFSGNLYLTDLDHYILEKLPGITYYYRYMDDMVLFASNKMDLINAVNMIQRFLFMEKLTMKETWQINETCSDGLDFVGYKMFPDYVLARTSIRKSYVKAVKEIIGLPENIHNRCRYYSLKGFVMYANSYNLQSKYGYNLENLWERAQCARDISIYCMSGDNG